MQESGEMYLETILLLGNRNAFVRAIDVAKEMGYSKPSISRALSKLKSDNYILVDTNGHVTLTESGRYIAEKIYERHVVLTKVLINMGVDEKTAQDDACRIEHVISDESFGAVKRYCSTL